MANNIDYPDYSPKHDESYPVSKETSIVSEFSSRQIFRYRLEISRITSVSHRLPIYIDLIDSVKVTIFIFVFAFLKHFNNSEIFSDVASHKNIYLLLKCEQTYLFPCNVLNNC